MHPTLVTKSKQHKWCDTSNDFFYIYGKIKGCKNVAMKYPFVDNSAQYFLVFLKLLQITK